MASLRLILFQLTFTLFQVPNIFYGLNFINYNNHDIICNIYLYICIYCSVVEGSHDKESSINTPEGGFIHNMVCRSDGVLVAVLRCSPRVFTCLVDRLWFRQGRIRHKLVSGKEARDRTLILRLTGDLSLPVSGSPTAYLAVGKRAPGVADPAVTSWCR